MTRLFLTALIALPAAAWGQTQNASTSTADVIRAADDAFGRRVGIEDVGLYGESEVRGFNLQNAGNYRIEDHYYVRATGLPPAASGGTSIRVGVNGLRTDFAAPSGVVQYDLPVAEAGRRGSIEAGWWSGSGPTLVGSVGLADGGAAPDLYVGAQLNPWQAYTDGTGGTFGAVALVPRWRPAPGVRLSAIGMMNWFKRDADTLFATAGAPPPRLRRAYNRAQPWMQARTDALVAGLFGDVSAGSWEFAGSFFLSQSKDHYGSLSLLILPEGGGPALARAVLSPREIYSSTSAEAKAAKTFHSGNVTHRLYGTARWRKSLSRTSAGAAVSLGEIADLDALPSFAPQPAVALPPTGRDRVDQWTFGLGYRGSLGALAELRLDAQKVRYAKAVAPAGEDGRQEISRPWLFSGSLAIAATADFTLFASYARGLEEAGVAPGNAVNRGEVLAAAIARQAEVGVKYAVPGGLSLIAGLFDISKPMPGLRSDSIFTYIGDVRHRGVELSLAGPLTPRLSTVVGATFLDARISGELVDGGHIGPRPVGRPDAVALASLTWDVPGISGVSLDGGVSMRGARPANSANTERLPAYATVNLGLRHRFRLGDADFTLRARVNNLLNSYAWTVNSAGLFNYNGPRVYTLTLTGTV